MTNLFKACIALSTCNFCINIVKHEQHILKITAMENVEATFSLYDEDVTTSWTSEELREVEARACKGFHIADTEDYTNYTSNILLPDSHKSQLSSLKSEIPHFDSPSLISSQPAVPKNVCTECKQSDHQYMTLLQADLINYYFEEFRKVAIIASGHVTPNLLQFHVPPTWSRLNLQGIELQNKQSKCTSISSYHDIFVKNSRTCQKIFISSPAGCGKSSLVKRIALTYCQAHQPVESHNKWFSKHDINEMRQFDYLFFVDLRKSHGNECDIEIMIQSQLLSNLVHSDAYAKLEPGFLRSLLSNEKCLVILDGLDMWSHPENNNCKKRHTHIPHSRNYPSCTTITTSRPWKLEVIALEDGEIDQMLELNNLNDYSLRNMIEIDVRQLNELHQKDMKADDFVKELEDKKLMALCKSPQIVMHLLTLWFNNEPLGHSQCEISCNLIELILKLYLPETLTFVDICDERVPPIFKDRKQCKAQLNLLLKLGRTAFCALVIDTQESLLKFDMTFDNKIMNKNDFEMNCKGSRCTNEDVNDPISKLPRNFWFLVETFQEFLAALYLVIFPEKVKHIGDKIMRICCSHENVLKMSQIFMFMNELNPHIMEYIGGPLRRIVSSDSWVNKYRCGYPQLSLSDFRFMKIDTSIVNLERMPAGINLETTTEWLNKLSSTTYAMETMTIESFDLICIHRYAPEGQSYYQLEQPAVRDQQAASSTAVSSTVASLIMASGEHKVATKHYNAETHNVDTGSDNSKRLTLEIQGCIQDENASPLLNLQNNTLAESFKPMPHSTVSIKKLLRRHSGKSRFKDWYENYKDDIKTRTWNALAIDIDDIPVYWIEFEPIQDILTQIAERRSLSPRVTMRYEILRFCTFRTYPMNNKPFILRLAGAGFYYASDSDGVICYTCGLRRYHWTENDTPKDIHFKINPSCEFFTMNDEVNVPVTYFGPARKCLAFLETIPDVDPMAHALTEDVSSEPSSITTESIQATSVNQVESLMGISTALPKQPGYAALSTREASFKDWPTDSSQTPQTLADAGFYYAGPGDCVICFFCGIGLRHWAKEDDPWIEHARWSKTCVYVRQKKGQEFVDLVQLAVEYSQNREEQSDLLETPIANRKLEKILLSDAGQRILEMGYQTGILRRAIEVLLRLKGETNITATTLLEKVLELEEENSCKNNVVVKADKGEITRETKNPSNTAEAASNNDIKLEVTDPRAIKAENEMLKEQTLCKVCLDKTVCIVFLPCGHLVTCADCAPAMRKCPICRATVRGTVRTYML